MPAHCPSLHAEAMFQYISYGSSVHNQMFTCVCSCWGERQIAHFSSSCIPGDLPALPCSKLLPLGQHPG